MKFNDNLIWNSKIIVPELRQAIIAQYDKQLERQKKELAEEELEQLSYKIQESFEYRVSITLQMYDKLEDTYVIGIVDRIDTMKKRFNVNGDWFYISDVEKIIN